MTFKVRNAFGAILLFVVLTSAPRMTSQQPAQPATSSPSPTPGPPQSAPPKGLADVAREQREKSGGSSSAPASAAPTPQQQPPAQRSLGDIARERATNKRAEVKINESDSKRLFAEMDEILDFAAHDSGLPRRMAVKHVLVGQDEVTRHTAAALSDSEGTQRIARSEAVLKKFGYLPADFDLKKYLVAGSTQSLGGFYDFKTKTMNLVDWVGLEEQRPIMAHELTHALQDQNYNLMTWLRSTPPAPSMRVVAADAAEISARRAVVEGQAMLVYFDYLLQPYGHTLSDTPGATEFIKDKMTSSYDTTLVVHNSPLMLKDSAIFPYREGVMFELELLRKGGAEMAFTGAFARPPATTHEILEPQAYLEKEPTPFIPIPDLSVLLGSDYEAYDTGTIGQLDARILTQQLGSENDMFTIAPHWLGGSYVAVARKSTAGAASKPASTADIALLYVSRWKTPEAAQRFLEVYQKSLAKRLTVTDTKPWLPAGCSNAAACTGHKAARVETNEGPVFLELIAPDTVFIVHSFPEQIVNNLRQAMLRHPTGSTRASAGDLSLRLQELPGFCAFQDRVAREILESLNRAQK